MSGVSAVGRRWVYRVEPVTLSRSVEDHRKPVIIRLPTRPADPAPPTPIDEIDDRDIGDRWDGLA